MNAQSLSASDRHPLHVEFEDGTTPTCERHGEMTKFNPVVLRDGVIHVPREMADIRVCKECCVAEIAAQTGMRMPPEASIRLVWRDHTDKQWAGHAERMFDPVGGGEFDDGVAVIDDPVDDIPEVAERSDQILIL